MFDLSKLGVGEWFPYQESKMDTATKKYIWTEAADADERVCFKQIDPDTFRIMNEKFRGKKIVTPALNPETRKMEVVISYDQSPEENQKQTIEYWDKVIADWTLKDPDGKVIPCTADNKYKLVTMSPAFLRFCNRSIEIMTGAKIAGEEAAEKD